MVFPVGVLAAVLLGLGYVLQQRVASDQSISDVLHWRLLLRVMRRRLWWAGIGAMVAGGLLAGLALELATVAVVEPLLSTGLLFALGFAALVSRNRIRWQEAVGALVLSASLACFLAVGNPHSSKVPTISHGQLAIAVGAVAAAVTALVIVGRRRGLVGESVLLATGAGLLYGLQDAATRGAIVVVDRHGFAAVLVDPWAYVLVGAAILGLLLSQSAFKAARLDYSLPPIAAAEPVAGILLGITLLGDKVSVSVLGLAVEAACLVGMVAGVALIGRSPNLAECAGAALSPVPAEPANSL